ncbi:MAG: hypothetical protein AB1898_08290 [Acidobacteriota bacterium]
MLDALQYVKQYHNLWTPEFLLSGAQLKSAGALWTPVYQYLNAKYKNKAGKTPSERLEYKDHLLGFFKARAGEAGSGVTYSEGGGYNLASFYPVHEFPKSSFMASFSGKGSPQMLSDIIQLISYWRSYKKLKQGVNVSPVAEIADKYLGVDCNGFVGHYLRTKFAGVSVKPSTTEKSFSQSGPRRGYAIEIQADDVLVFDGFHHVAVVNSVAKKTPEWAECMVCESRSKDNGGPQANVWRIEVKKSTAGLMSGYFMLKHLNGSVREDLHSIVRVWGT